LEIPTEAAISCDKESRLDMVALILVSLVIEVSVLFPENFISGLPVFRNVNTFPLTLMLPLMALVTAIYIGFRRKYIKASVVDGLVLIFTAYILIRNINGPESLLSGKYIIYGLGIFYITALLTVKKETLLKQIVYTIASLVLLTSIYGLIEYGFQKNFIYSQFIAEAVPEPRVGLHRIGSTLAHPVPFGAFIIQSLPFVILIWVGARQSWLRASAMATTMLAVLALFFTYSKGSWIAGVLVAIGTLFFLRRSRSRKYIFPAVIIVAMLTVMLGVFWQQVYSEIENRAAISFDMRISSWQTALEDISGHPLIGVGFKQGAEEIKKHANQEENKGLEKALPVDNYYLSLMLEAGMIGFILWMSFLIFMVLEGIKILRLHGHSQRWALAALVSVLAIVVNTFTFESMHIWPNFMLFWLSAGILHGLYWENTAVGEESGKHWKEFAEVDLV